MKLELKHLTPYLPYELKFIGGSCICTMDELLTNCNLVKDWDGDYYPIEEIKPLLNPVGSIQSRDARQLLELIFGVKSNGLEINIKKDGEYAVLIDASDECQWYYVSIYNPKPNDSCISVEASYVDGDIVQPIPYSVYEYLFSEHFDVFGLIEKGLAV